MTRRPAALIALAAALCMTTVPASAAEAPAPAKPVDPARFYTGRWLEIARLPMKLTDGCVAGTTDYSPGEDGKVTVLDACQVGAPGGRTKSIKGTGTLLDAGSANATLKVRYPFFITWTYRVLDHADDYSWFISADPTFEKLWIYTREVPDAAERQTLVARAAALGYDVSRLEFPEF
jgi:apolipoprotein D and lipocalin family protein